MNVIETVVSLRPIGFHVFFYLTTIKNTSSVLSVTAEEERNCFLHGAVSKRAFMQRPSSSLPRRRRPLLSAPSLCAGLRLASHYYAAEEFGVLSSPAALSLSLSLLAFC